MDPFKRAFLTILGSFVAHITPSSCLSVAQAGFNQSTTASVAPLSTKANTVFIKISPSAVLASGAAMNLSCIFLYLPLPDFISLVKSTNNGTVNLIQVNVSTWKAVMSSNLSTRVKYSANGVVVTFAFKFTASSDSGMYKCHAAGGIQSDQIFAEIVTCCTNMLTTSTRVYGSGMEPGTVSLSMIVSSVVVSVCIFMGFLLVTLRLKYGKRCLRMMGTCRRARPNATPGNEQPSAPSEAGTGIGTGTEQLPSYEVAVKMAMSECYLPPSYDNVANECGCVSATGNSDAGLAVQL